MESKPLLVFLEGPDGCGKTTLRRILQEIGVYIIERSPVSIPVYSEFLRRDFDLKYVRSLEETFQRMFNIVPVYLVCKTDILKKRMNRVNKRIRPKDLDKIVFLFQKYLMLSIWDWKYVHTDTLSPSQSAEVVKTYIRGALR